MSDLSYPIGKHNVLDPITPESLAAAKRDIRDLPLRVREATAGLDERQLDTPYRPGGWTVRQVVHHIPDSHLNAYTRLRLALTEDAPMIRPYDETRWAELHDARTLAIGPSISLLEGLHARWSSLLDSLDDPSLARTLTHPVL